MWWFTSCRKHTYGNKQEYTINWSLLFNYNAIIIYVRHVGTNTPYRTRSQLQAISHLWKKRVGFALHITLFTCDNSRKENTQRQPTDSKISRDRRTRTAIDSLQLFKHNHIVTIEIANYISFCTLSCTFIVGEWQESICRRNIDLSERRSRGSEV